MVEVFAPVDPGSFEEYAESREGFTQVGDTKWYFEAEEGRYAFQVREDPDLYEGTVLTASREAMAEVFGVNWDVVEAQLGGNHSANPMYTEAARHFGWEAEDFMSPSVQVAGMSDWRPTDVRQKDPRYAQTRKAADGGVPEDDSESADTLGEMDSLRTVLGEEVPDGAREAMSRGGELGL